MISFHWLADPPWPPGKPVVKDVGRTSLMLNWTKPEHDGGAKIDSYVIEMLKTGTEDWGSVSSPAGLLRPCIKPRAVLATRSVCLLPALAPTACTPAPLLLE